MLRAINLIVEFNDIAVSDYGLGILTLIVQRVRQTDAGGQCPGMLENDNPFGQLNNEAIDSICLSVIAFVIERSSKVVTAEKSIRMFQPKDLFPQFDHLPSLTFSLSMFLFHIQGID